MTPTVRNSTAGELSAAPRTRTSPWMARLIEEFELQGCAVFPATSADTAWDLVVAAPPDQALRLVWAHAPIERGPLAVLVNSPESRPIRSPRAVFAERARRAGFVPVVAIHQPGLPERSLWRVEPA